MAVVVYPLGFGVWELYQSHGPFHMRSAWHHFANPVLKTLRNKYSLPSTNSTDLATCPISGDVMCMVTRDLVSQPIILQWHMIQGSVICDLSLLITSTTLLRKTKDHQTCPMFPFNFLKLAKEKKESSGGVVVRALGSHQCGPGSIPRLGVICGLSLLVLFSAQRGFPLGTPVYPSPQKPAFV